VFSAVPFLRVGVRNIWCLPDKFAQAFVVLVMEATSSAHEQILYALVAREVSVLAEHQLPSVPFDLPTATRLVLQRIPAENKRHTFEFDQDFLFVIIVEGGICFLCLCRKTAELRRALGFLQDIAATFMEKFGQEAYTAHAYALNSTFAPILEQRLDFYNNDPEVEGQTILMRAHENP